MVLQVGSGMDGASSCKEVHHAVWFQWYANKLRLGLGFRLGLGLEHVFERRSLGLGLGLGLGEIRVRPGFVIHVCI